MWWGPISIVMMHTPFTPVKILISFQTCIQILTSIHTFFGVLYPVGRKYLDCDLNLDLECLPKLYFCTHIGRDLDLECLLACTLKCFECFLGDDEHDGDIERLYFLGNLVLECKCLLGDNERDSDVEHLYFLGDLVLECKCLLGDFERDSDVECLYFLGDLAGLLFLL